MPTEPRPPAPAAAPALLVVILNYNGAADTLACLESLDGQSVRDFAVMVVDNSPDPAEPALLRARRPGLEVVVPGENLGWAGGNNIGLRAALERGVGHVLLLNNDTILDPTAVEELLAASARVGEPCLMHPLIAYHEAPENLQLRADEPRSLLPQPRVFPPETGIVELDFAYGACLLLPARLVGEVGLLDERFFLQLEETDYFRRALALGYRSFCARRARILHKESVSFQGRVTPGKTYYQVRNTLLLTGKHDRTPRGVARMARAMLWTVHNQALSSGAGFRGWLGFARWLASNQPMPRAVRDGVRDYLAGRFGPRPAPKN